MLITLQHVRKYRSTGYRDARTIRFSAYQNVDLLTMVGKEDRRTGGGKSLIMLAQIFETKRNVDRVMTTSKVGFYS